MKLAGNEDGLVRQVCWRLPLVAAAVILCYHLEWSDLRYLTSEVTLWFARWLGYSAVRLGPYLIAWNGAQFKFGIACTFADVLCGAIPLIWVRHWGLIRNLANLSMFAAMLITFNFFRICVTDLFFSFGVPWLAVDQIIGGVSYFAVWLCLMSWMASPKTWVDAFAARLFHQR